MKSLPEIVKDNDDVTGTTTKTHYEFINFEVINGCTGQYWICRNNKSGDALGEVIHYRRWKQWVFAPTGESIYSAGCLKDICEFIGQLK